MLRPGSTYGGGAVTLQSGSVVSIIDTTFIENVDEVVTNTNNPGHDVFVYSDIPAQGNPLLYFINSKVGAGANRYGFHSSCLPSNGCGIQSCTAAPTQCQDNGYNNANIKCLDKSNTYEGVKCYQLPTNAIWKWGEMPPAPVSKSHGGRIVLFNNTLIGFGGLSPQRSNDVYMFNLKTRLWLQPTTSGMPPSIRCDHSVTLWNDSLVVFGGNNHPTNYNDLYFLNGKNTAQGDSLQRLDTMSLVVCAFTAWSGLFFVLYPYCTAEDNLSCYMLMWLVFSVNVAFLVYCASLFRKKVYNALRNRLCRSRGVEGSGIGGVGKTLSKHVVEIEMSRGTSVHTNPLKYRRSFVEKQETENPMFGASMTMDPVSTVARRSARQIAMEEKTSNRVSRLRRVRESQRSQGEESCVKEMSDEDVLEDGIFVKNPMIEHFKK
eukprot:g6544.t1